MILNHKKKTSRSRFSRKLFVLDCYSQAIPHGSNICILLYLCKKEGFCFCFPVLLQAVRHFTGQMCLCSMLWVNVNSEYTAIKKKTQPPQNLNHTFDDYLQSLQHIFNILLFIWDYIFFLHEWIDIPVTVDKNFTHVLFHLCTTHFFLSFHCFSKSHTFSFVLI